VLKTLLSSGISLERHPRTLVATAPSSRKARLGASPTSGRMSRLATSRCGFRSEEALPLRLRGEPPLLVDAAVRPALSGATYGVGQDLTDDLAISPPSLAQEPRDLTFQSIAVQQLAHGVGVPESSLCSSVGNMFHCMINAAPRHRRICSSSAKVASLGSGKGTSLSRLMAPAAVNIGALRLSGRFRLCERSSDGREVGT
jgi:hypothetical protein